MQQLRIREKFVISFVSKILSDSRSFEDTLYELLKALYSYLGVNFSLIGIREFEKLKVIKEFTISESIAKRVKKYVNGELVNKVYEKGIPIILPCESSGYLIAVPVKTGGETVGIIIAHKEFERNEKIEPFVETFSTVANILGLYLKLNEKLEEEKKRWEEERKILTKELQEKYSFHGIVGKSKAIRNLIDIVEKISKTDSTVLILGESGTGKSLIAKIIHYESHRKDKPFITVNCASIPENLLEAELFGYEKGAFTGAYKSKKGKFELAQGGTIFLDEIGDMPLSIQPKILRVIQEKEFEPLGSEKTIKVDVRIIAATNKDLKKLVEEGKFREDLYYRLNVIPVYIPPLRERREDIPILIEYYLNEFNKKYGKNVRISKEAMKILLDYDYPGNVRELANIVERLVILNDKVVDKGSLYFLISNNKEEEKELPKLIEETEKQRIIEALEKTGYVKSRAAKLLGYTLRQLDYRIKKYGIEIKKL